MDFDSLDFNDPNVIEGLGRALRRIADKIAYSNIGPAQKRAVVAQSIRNNALNVQKLTK